MDELTEAYIQLQQALAQTEAGQNQRNRQVIERNIGEAMLIGVVDETRRSS